MNLGLIFLGVGGVSLLLGIFFFVRTRRFLSGAVTVQGTVMDLVARSSSEGGLVYSPSVQFTTVEGETHMFTDSVGSSPPRHTPGQTVSVMYTPGDPTSARIPSWFRLWFLPLFFLLFGVTFAGVGVFTFDSTPATDEGPGGISAPDLPGMPDIDIPAIDISPDKVPQGEVIVIQKGQDLPQISELRCASLRDRKMDREVRLTFEGGDLTFRASPYTGPGPYMPEQNLQLESTVFPRNAAVTGAVIFDQTGEAGVVNLVAGDTSASGNWSCA